MDATDEAVRSVRRLVGRSVGGEQEERTEVDCFSSLLQR